MSERPRPELVNTEAARAPIETDSERSTNLEEQLLDLLKEDVRTFSTELRKALKDHSYDNPLRMNIDADDTTLLEAFGDVSSLLRFLKAKSDGGRQCLRVTVHASEDLNKMYPNELSSGVAFEIKS